METTHPLLASHSALSPCTWDVFQMQPYLQSSAICFSSFWRMDSAGKSKQITGSFARDTIEAPAYVWQIWLARLLIVTR